MGMRLKLSSAHLTSRDFYVWSLKLGTVRSDNGWSPGTANDQLEKEFHCKRSVRMDGLQWIQRKSDLVDL